MTFFAHQVAGFDTLHPLTKMHLIHEEWKKKAHSTEVGISSKGNIGFLDVYPDKIRPNLEERVRELKK